MSKVKLQLSFSTEEFIISADYSTRILLLTKSYSEKSLAVMLLDIN